MNPGTSTRTPGLRGHLHLVCQADARGRTVLAAQSFRAPFHISKPHWDGAALTVQVVNPTAGLFGGDVAEVRVRVEAGARLRLVSPSALRVHPGSGGEASEAILEQHFTVAEGGWLETQPELLIPQAGSRLRQSVRIDVAPGGNLFHLEMLVPGRVASGEVFAFHSLKADTDVFLGSRLIARDRLRLLPDGRPGSLGAWTRIFPAPAYAAIYWITSGSASAGHAALEAVHQLQSDDVWIGASRLIAGGCAVRILARDARRLRRAVEQTRAHFFAASPGSHKPGR